MSPCNSLYILLLLPTIAYPNRVFLFRLHLMLRLQKKQKNYLAFVLFGENSKKRGVLVFVCDYCFFTLLIITSVAIAMAMIIAIPMPKMYVSVGGNVVTG
jgi:hypothetical protein